MNTPARNLAHLLEDRRELHADELAAFLEAYRNYLALLARTGIPNSLQGKADPSDLVQDTLVKAIERFDQFRGKTEGELVAWLRQILARNLTDLARRYHSAAGRQVAREMSLDATLDASSAKLRNLLAAEKSTPSQSAQRRELSVVLADALAELAADYREVLVLRSIEEQDWDHIAQQMGRSPGAVRMLWTRALQQLRPLIEGRL
jgi:RNA polymerase sigma-70 factor (ECF subfamily)